MVVGVSGGADSVALLDILVRLDLGLNLIVAHLNHSLRGEESDGDEAFVEELASRYGHPCVVRRVDVASLAAAERLSLEDAGRRARYAFFAETANEFGAAAIAVAHHRDDQAETVLMRLLRGAGGSGLSGMAGWSGRIRRPLLRVSRADLELYLQDRGLVWRNDSSNSDTDFLRNSIRHELIPFLSRYNPKVSERLAATAEILACDEELLEQVTASAFDRLATCEEVSVTFDLDALSAEPRALRFRLYRRALREVRGDLMRIGLQHLEAIDRLALSERPNSQAKLPGDCHVVRCYQSLRFTGARTPADSPWEVAVAGEGSYLLPGGWELRVESVPCPPCLDAGSRRIAYLLPDAAPFPWIVRNFRNGDRLTPLGMSGRQKVKDLFINEKVPPPLRARIPLLETNGEILWVAGVKLAEKARVKDVKEPVFRVEILEITP